MNNGVKVTFINNKSKEQEIVYIDSTKDVVLQLRETAFQMDVLKAMQERNFDEVLVVNCNNFKELSVPMKDLETTDFSVLDEGETETKEFSVVVYCQACYRSSIRVPANYTHEQALAYAKARMDIIPCGELEYISDDDIDEENCFFSES